MAYCRDSQIRNKTINIIKDMSYMITVMLTWLPVVQMKSGSYLPKLKEFSDEERWWTAPVTICHFKHLSYILLGYGSEK